VGGLIKQSIIQGMTDVFHGEINLMRRTPDAHELSLKLVINSCYCTSVVPSHRVLAIGAESNNLRSLACIQRIQNVTDHGSNVFCCMTIIKKHCDQVQILQGTIGTNANLDVKVWHKLMHGAINNKRKWPHRKKAQDVWNVLKINGNTHTDILANYVIVEAHQLCILKHLFVLINNSRCLTKRQTNWSVIKSEFEFAPCSNSRMWGSWNGVLCDMVCQVQWKDLQWHICAVFPDKTFTSYFWRPGNLILSKCGI